MKTKSSLRKALAVSALIHIMINYSFAQQPVYLDAKTSG